MKLRSLKSAKRKTSLPWNWRSRLEITSAKYGVGDRASGSHSGGQQRTIGFRLSFKKGQTPKGFPNHIGSLCVDNKPPYFVDSAEIKDYFQRRGLGTMLYLHALNQLGSLSTLYFSASKEAQGLWRRLVRLMDNNRQDFFAGTLTVFKRTEKKQRIV